MSETNLESYPPVFRQHNTIPATDHGVVVDDDKIIKEIQEFVGPLPVIDLQKLSLEKLGEACKNWGLFRLVNHGIPSTLLSQLQDHSKKIFSLSFDSKKTLITNPLSYFWGTPALTSSGAALSSGGGGEGGHQNINWVEGVNAPLSQLSQFQAQDPALDSFRLLLEEYGEHVTRIATIVFQAMVKTLNLNLNPEQSKSYLSESTGFVRIYRYPQCTMANQTLGMTAHTDSSVLSILTQQEQVSGLQLFKDDQWLHVQPVPDTLILNVGDMMQAISDDEYKSAVHRVKAKKCDERISICYFVFPDDESVIHSSKYKTFTYSNFRDQVQQDIKTLGFKVGLDRFKLTEPAGT